MVLDPAASNIASPAPVGAPEQTMKKKRSLEEDVATVHRQRDADGDRQRPDRIGPLQSWRMSRFIMDDLVYTDEMIHLRLGLVANPGERERSRQFKLEQLHSLASRGADVQDPALFTRGALLRFKLREAEIRRQHSPPKVMEEHDHHAATCNGYDVLEELLLDAGFILEQLLQHWEARTRATMVVRRKQYRLELVLLTNQIPYLLLQELIHMVKIPPPPIPVENKDILGGEYFLRSIAIGFIVDEQAPGLQLTEYTGPVYHLLHLVYLYLEQLPPLPRRSLWARCKAKALRRLCKLSEGARSVSKAIRRALRRHAMSETTDTGAGGHALLATAWWSYTMIPPARDLCRSGIQLRPKKGTRCLAAVSFRDGVLELPPLDLIGFDCLLLINLVALELEWESSQPLFLSYAVFMSELLRTKWDMDQMQSAGIVTPLRNSHIKRGQIAVLSHNSEEWFFFKLLADLNSGRELHPHFLQLARDIKSYYDRQAAACAPTFSC